MLSFLLLEEMSSRVWELNKKTHHYTAKYVLNVYIKYHFVLILDLMSVSGTSVYQILLCSWVSYCLKLIYFVVVVFNVPPTAKVI